MTDRSTPRNLSECLCPVLSDVRAERIEAVEEYRKEYEKSFGPTDITLNYTTMWPREHQLWMEENEMQTYFDGFPPFFKAFVKSEIKKALKDGRGDDWGANFVKLYCSGGMSLDNDQGRGR